MTLIILFEKVAIFVLNKPVSQVKFKKCSEPDAMKVRVPYKSSLHCQYFEPTVTLKISVLGKEANGNSLVCVVPLSCPFFRPTSCWGAEPYVRELFLLSHVDVLASLPLSFLSSSLISLMFTEVKTEQSLIEASAFITETDEVTMD